ncbi:MAG: tRNA dihydrouridine synthase DusB [bacterium]|nr:tRNA dihydrouridine synthase DusB [bacterium]
MRIGDFEPATNLLLSPIAGYCDLSFRLVVRSLGGLGLACTDLLSPQGLLRQTKHSLDLAATCPEDQPLGMQLYGCNPAVMADGARWAADHGARVIDLNMGCPADRVVKKDGGVALMAQPERAVAVARAVVEAVDLPVTAKMRLGCDASNLNAPQLARMLEDAGIQAVTVHGRTGAQRFGGSVDLDGIAAVVEAVRHIPIIGNGDIKSPADAKRMIDRTGCAGLMIGRRALSDPWIFRDTHAYLTTGRIPPPPTLQDRVAVMVTHFENLRRYRDDRAACIVLRQRTTWYARMLPRTKRLKQSMNLIATPEEFYENVDAYVQENGAHRGMASSLPA